MACWSNNLMDLDTGFTILWPMSIASQASGASKCHSPPGATEVRVPPPVADDTDISKVDIALAPRSLHRRHHCFHGMIGTVEIEFCGDPSMILSLIAT